MVRERLPIPYSKFMSGQYGRIIGRTLEVLSASSFEAQLWPVSVVEGAVSIRYSSVRPVLTHPKVDYATASLFPVKVKKEGRILAGPEVFHSTLKPKFDTFLEKSARIHAEHPHLDSLIVQRLYENFVEGKEVVLMGRIPFVRSGDYSDFRDVTTWDYVFSKK
jgi:hypothetical protein